MKIRVFYMHSTTEATVGRNSIVLHCLDGGGESGSVPACGSAPYEGGGGGGEGEGLSGHAANLPHSDSQGLSA